MKIVSREWIYVTFLTVVVVAASFSPQMLLGRSTPAGSVYPLVHNYPADFYSNLSYMRFGWEGKFTVTSRYTPERFEPKFVSVLPLFGLVSRVFNVSLPVAYTAFRALFGTSLLILGYLLAATLIANRRERFVAFLLMVFGAPLWSRNVSGYTLAGSYWSGFDPIGRVSFLPHHLMANSFLVLTFLAFSRAVSRRSWGLSALAGVCALLSGWANPGSYYTIAFALGTAGLLHARTFLNNWKLVLLMVVAIVVPTIYLYRLQYTVFPFTTYKDIERFWFYPAYNGNLLMVLGMTGFLAIIGVWAVLGKRSILWSLITGWFAAVFFGVEVLGRFVPVTNARYFQSAFWIPAAVLAAAGIRYVLAMIHSMRGRTVAAVTLVTFFSVNAVGAFAISISNHVQKPRETPISLLVYVPVGMVRAIAWLGSQGKPDDVVLAPYWASLMIPGLTDKRVVMGYEINTYRLEEKLWDFTRFYAYEDPKEARGIVERYRVSYVIFEKVHLPSDDFFTSVALDRVFEDEAVVVAKVKRSPTLRSGHQLFRSFGARNPAPNARLKTIHPSG